MLKKQKNSKKSQVWTIEFIVSFLIFIAAIILSVKSVFNIYTNENLRDIQRESEFVSQYLLSEGFPSDWNNDTIIRPGLTTSNRLNYTKLKNLYDLNYDKAKYSLGIRSNFFIYFSNATGNIPLFYMINDTLTESEGCGYGHPLVSKQYTTECIIGFDSLRYADMTKVSRITNFNGSIIQMNVIIWR